MQVWPYIIGFAKDDIIMIVSNVEISTKLVGYEVVQPFKPRKGYLYSVSFENDKNAGYYFHLVSIID